MADLKIDFVDFWPNFKKNDNYFFHLLNSQYNTTINEVDPDVIFFSVDYARKKQRDKYKNHRCKKIFFTGENVRPNFDGAESIEYPRYSIGKADFAFTFDYSTDSRNYRLPLWSFFINWFDKPYDHSRDPAYLIPLDNLTKRSPQKKDRFCNFLFQNTSGARLHILDIITRYKTVTCAGKLRNNSQAIGGRGDQQEKINFLQNFKFTIAAENCKQDGYTTEKLIHPLSVGSIPIYWGSDKVTEEFNSHAFINANTLTAEELLDQVITLDTDKDLYDKMVAEPIFINNQIPTAVQPSSVLNFFSKHILC